jgi:hypothetical protein
MVLAAQMAPRFLAKKEQLERFYGLEPESQSQNMAVTV